MFMRGRHSRTAVLERDLSEAGSRAVETIGELAEHAIAAARDAGQAATPAIQHSAENLGKALERAAEAIADSKLARTGEQRAAEAALVARERIADASERLAGSIRPRKRKTHRVRNLLIATAVVGGVVALVQSPLRSKITQRLFGPPPEDEPDSIQLPGSDSLDTGGVTGGTTTTSTTVTSEQTVDTSTASGVEGDGVPTAQGGRESQA